MPLIEETKEGKTVLKIFGTRISLRAVLEAQVHTVVETVALVGWLALARPITGLNLTSTESLLSITVLFVGLDIEHILALAAGKDA
jgi:hypothetical protein